MGYKNYNNRLFKFLDRYHILIFQHLTVQEMMVFAEVEDSINKSIQNCAHCMSRICYKVEGDRHEVHRRLEYLAKSKRDYRSIYMNCVNIRDLSRIAMHVLHIYFGSCMDLTVTRMNVKESYYDFSLPSLKYLKISFSSLATLYLMMKASTDHQMITIQNMNIPKERNYVEDIMSYRSVRLLNCKLEGLSSLDFMYNNCIDFQLETDRKDDFDELIDLLNNVVNPDEISIMPRDSPGFRFIVHRMNQNFTNKNDVLLFSRRNKKNEKVVKLMRNPRLFSDNFLISLEIDDLNYSLIKRLGQVMTNLQVIRIFEINNQKKKLFFEHFRNLESIITITSDDMESENFATRPMFKIKKSKDPLKIFDKEIVELILQNLEIDQLFTFLEVSTKWNQIIGESSAFNKRIILRLNRHNFANEDHEVLFKSKKSFENIEIDGNDEKFIIPHAIDVIHMFSACLKELTLKNISVYDYKHFQPLVFKKLKVVKINSVDSKFSDNIFENLTTLEELVLQNSSFKEHYFEYIKNMKNLKSFRSIDSRFDNYSSSYSDSKDIEIKNLQYLEISFYNAVVWNVMESHGGFENFLQKFTLFNVHTAKLCGIRSKMLNKILNRIRKVKKLELVNFWHSDLEELQNFQAKCDIYTQNVHFMNDINWRKCFRGLQGIHVGSVFNDNNVYTTQADREFKRIMKTNWRKMTYDFNSCNQLGSHDPLMRLPEDIHELIFQHITMRDFRNCMEVSKTWSFYTRNCRAATNKIRLKFTKETTRDRHELMKNCDIKCSDIAMLGSCISYLTNFVDILRELTIFTSSSCSPDILFEYPCLESLTICRQYQHCDNEEVYRHLEHFTKCKKLKLLAIHEKLNENSVEPLMILLKNNPDLKELRIFHCLAYKKIFKNDFSDEIPFKLEKLAIDIGYDQASIRNTDYEKNFIQFLKLHVDTLKVLRMRAVTGRIMNEVFTNCKVIETFYSSKGTGFEDFRNAMPSGTMLNLALPNDFTASSNIIEFVNRAIYCEHFYVNTINLDLLREIVLKMKNLKILSYIHEKENCLKNYDMLLVDNDQNLNAKITFKKLSTNTIELENLDFEKIFNSRW
ncbi:hypothetical protein PVAND_014862 [Polypedilum vanderplanki]|uniref:F-box domain-containing protein n=1 Tax=Polypedilum vanderplanki TaxID=319348 RepID=A0A9J6BB86_POLVA|nr:hypothetical protein PVAND_014862 [Polypedilum vanderplanki]